MRAGAVALMAAGLAAADQHSIGASYSEQNAEGMWDAFKRTHGRKYKDSDEESTRYQHFKDNMKKAAAASAGNPHAKFGVTPFSDLSEAEWKARQGYRAKPASLSQAVQQAPRASLKDISSAKRHNIDWRAAGVVTGVKNQGKCGGCWAFATVGSIEGAWARALHPLTSLSEQELISCANYPGLGGCSGGNSHSALQWLLDTKQGAITTEERYPYTEGGCDEKQGCKADSCKYEATMPVGARIVGFHDISGVPDVEGEMLVKLRSNGPISVGVASGLWQHYTGGILTGCTDTHIDHGVLVVGYGLSKDVGSQYWIIKNSWGSGWGEGGYIKVQYGTNQCGIRQQISYAVVQAPPSAPGVASVPVPLEQVPAVVPAQLPEPWLVPVDMPVTPAPNGSHPYVCVSGDDCDCPDMHIGMNGKKYWNVCDSTLVVAALSAIVFFLIGVGLSRCCCTQKRIIAVR